MRNARLCAAYQTVLAGANRLDFDDLLLATVRTLHEHPDARRAAGDRFPRVLVDEFQEIPDAVRQPRIGTSRGPSDRRGNRSGSAWQCH